MKSFLVFAFVIVVVLGFIFWDRISPGGDDENVTEDADSPIIVEEPEVSFDEPVAAGGGGDSTSYRALIQSQRWGEALQRIESMDPASVPLDALDAKHLCLVREGRLEEADQLVDDIIARAPDSKQALRCVLRSMKDGAFSPLEKRQRISRVAGAFATLDSQTALQVVHEVGKINAGLPASVQGQVDVEKYHVVPNDNLWNICKDFRKRNGFGVESGLIKVLNGIEKDVIYPGQALIIPKEKVTLKIYRNSWLLAVFLGDSLLSAYQVGLGKMDKTPGGQFVIKTRLEHPDWYSEQHGRIIPFGDPDNILGTRWLGFENRDNARGFGIHGTSDPESIGKNMSSGCIRMRNKDVERLFDIVARGTPVVVL